jgi:hypothetical protein
MAAGVLALGACGGDDAGDDDALDAAGDAPGAELVGVWQVTSHTRNENGCGAEGPTVLGPAFIKFVEGQLAGQRYLEVVGCQDAAGTTCDSTGGSLLFYAEPIPAGLRASVFIASGTPSDCFLSALASDATVAGTSLRIETRQREEDGVTGTQCETDDAEARQATMPCISFEVLTGLRQ